MKEPIEIDVVFISYAQTEDLKQVTEGAIASLMNSEESDKIKFNVVVIESERSLSPYQYPYSQTVYPEVPFGYHEYLNIGINMTSAPFICLCNNDLVFHRNWATEILKPFFQYSDVVSASPFCSIHHPREGYKVNDGLRIGYRIREELLGWCIFLKRDILKRIGRLDRNLIFWCADNDYGNTLYMMKMPHILVTSSIVDHLESRTLNDQSNERKLELTDQETDYFKKKWYPKIGEGWKEID